jgi:deoxyribodipyrimidine photo-lyase
LNTCIWFRQDLRINDNTALLEASHQNKGILIGLYVITPETWTRHGWADCKVDFILRSLKDLSASLKKLGIPLKLLTVPTFEDSPNAITEFCISHKIHEVYANKQMLLDEIDRDEKSLNSLSIKKINFHCLDDATILHPDETKKSNNEPFKVFTPFKNNWLKKTTPDRYYPDSRTPKKQKPSSINSDTIPDVIPGFLNSKNHEKMWPAGEKTAHQRLEQFYLDKIDNYQSSRDFPFLNETSLISPYLANGVLSARQCLGKLCEISEISDINQLSSYPGKQVWLNEIIWREFYYTIAYLYPDTVKNKPFKPLTEKLAWSKNKKHFQAWCDGKTGFPFVDAGMRQLKETGWMHNRLRMVTAMFLTKTLFIDWRWGEKHFMRHLIDGDFASNNGGWQWSASTGTDAAPYFRIFNPTTQGERFDPQGLFIRQYCPELESCSNKEIHNPSSQQRKALGYPEPAVNYRLMREKVMTAFKDLKNE